MNLLQVREQFRDLSGRHDLVNKDGSDNGANFFINEGRKFLDRLDENQKTWGSYFRFINLGYYSAVFPHCRSLKEVWAMTSTERWQLEKMDLQNIIADYMTEIPSLRSTGVPGYYAPIITRYIPEDATVVDIETFIGWLDIPSGNAHEYNGIILNVPTSERISVDIRGLFYSMELVADTDTNYWSSVHSGLLLKSALRELETFSQNAAKIKLWNEAILIDAKSIGMDLVEELIAEVDQMEG